MKVEMLDLFFLNHLSLSRSWRTLSFEIFKLVDLDAGVEWNFFAVAPNGSL